MQLENNTNTKTESTVINEKKSLNMSLQKELRQALIKIGLEEREYAGFCFTKQEINQLLDAISVYPNDEIIQKSDYQRTTSKNAFMPKRDELQNRSFSKNKNRQNNAKVYVVSKKGRKNA